MPHGTAAARLIRAACPHGRERVQNRLKEKSPGRLDRLMLAVLANPHRIKASHRRRRRAASRVWFAGQYYDAETGLIHNDHRDYCAACGRYIESDPIGLAGGISTFTYGLNSPLSNVDPLGLESPRAASGCGAMSWAACGAMAPALPTKDCNGGGGGIDPTLLAQIVITEILGGGPEDPFADALVAEEIAASEATVTVGRVMSQTELDAMQETGMVQESFNNGVTSVTLPPNPTAYAAGPQEDIFVQFDVPQSSIGAADGTVAKIYGPNSIFGPAKGITQMPPATNIVVPNP